MIKEQEELWWGPYSMISYKSRIQKKSKINNDILFSICSKQWRPALKNPK